MDRIAYTNPKDWPHYKIFMKRYGNYYEHINTVLYNMCSSNLGHKDWNIVWGKVMVISRAYASGLERHLSDPRNSINPIVSELCNSSNWLDKEIRSLRRLQPIPSVSVSKELATLHYKVLCRISKHTRNNNSPRSFVSKYLHFHAPIFPIYDSYASWLINRYSRKDDEKWYPWQRLYRQYPQPDNTDRNYWRHLIQSACMAEDWQKAGLNASSRNIDVYLMYYYFHYYKNS